MLPKIGPTTSDGKVRRVFPMSAELQRIQDSMFSKVTVKLPNTEIVKGPTFPPYKHTYDIKGMDRTIYPYILRYARKKGVEDVLLPMVHGRKTGYVPQLPSGTTSTSVIGPIFTYAVARSCTDQKLFIQGDGIMTREPIKVNKYIREEKPYTINGFNYETGQPRYANALTRLNSPRLSSEETHSPRNVGVLQTKKQLRAAIYKVMLNSIDDLSMHWNKYFDYDKRRLAREANKYGVCQRKLEYLGYNPKSKCSMDVCATTPVYCNRHVAVDGVEIKKKWLTSTANR